MNENMVAKEENLPEIEMVIESVAVTPENVDEVACHLIAVHGPNHIKFRGNTNIFVPTFIADEYTGGESRDMVPSAEKPYRGQRDAIMSGKHHKLFFIVIKLKETK